jgi:hypothetical protein
MGISHRSSIDRTVYIPLWPCRAARALAATTRGARPTNATIHITSSDTGGPGCLGTIRSSASYNTHLPAHVCRPWPEFSLWYFPRPDLQSNILSMLEVMCVFVLQFNLYTGHYLLDRIKMLQFSFLKKIITVNKKKLCRSFVQKNRVCRLMAVVVTVKNIFCAVYSYRKVVYVAQQLLSSRPPPPLPWSNLGSAPAYKTTSRNLQNHNLLYWNRNSFANHLLSLNRKLKSAQDTANESHLSPMASSVQS